jgi:hypothetical protein
VDMEAGMTGEPSFHGFGLVSGVAVEDQVQVEFGRCLPVDQPADILFQRRISQIAY